jgi:hypothetical protein
MHILSILSSSGENSVDSSVRTSDLQPEETKARSWKNKIEGTEGKHEKNESIRKGDSIFWVQKSDCLRKLKMDWSNRVRIQTTSRTTKNARKSRVHLRRTGRVSFRTKRAFPTERREPAEWVIHSLNSVPASPSIQFKLITKNKTQLSFECLPSLAGLKPEKLQVFAVM